MENITVVVVLSVNERRATQDGRVAAESYVGSSIRIIVLPTFHLDEISQYRLSSCVKYVRHLYLLRPTGVSQLSCNIYIHDMVYLYSRTCIIRHHIIHIHCGCVSAYDITLCILYKVYRKTIYMCVYIYDV